MRSAVSTKGLLAALLLVGAPSCRQPEAAPRAAPSPGAAASPAPSPSAAPPPSVASPSPAPSPELAPVASPSLAPSEPAPAPSPPPAAPPHEGPNLRAVLRVAGLAWTRLDPGSEVSSLTEIRLANGTPVRTVRETQSLEARDGERVRIRFQLGAQVREPQGEIHPVVGDDALAAGVARGRETVELPAGRFECEHYRATYLEDGLVTTADLWVSPDVPVPVKTVETNARETTTTTVERCVRKPRPAR